MHRDEAIFGFVANQRASCVFGMSCTIPGAETYLKRWHERRLAFELLELFKDVDLTRVSTEFSPHLNLIWTKSH